MAPEARLASLQFTIWWYGLAASSCITAFVAFIAASGPLALPVGITAYLVMLLVDVGLLWGIASYCTYVYSGRYHLVPIAAFYSLFYAALLYFVWSQDPSGVVIRGASITLLYGTTPNPGLAAFVVLSLVFPEFIGAILYLSLYRRAREATQRYRILLVGTSLLLWFLVAFLVPSSTNVDGLAKSGLEVLAAVLSLLAYLPPKIVQDRLGVTSIDRGAGERANA
ncbi:MAG: hypothetical protein L3K18_06325 [Thermoplasmata archaeon]|nr:hypothetical protein [Thermoplasmata archaeon]